MNNPTGIRTEGGHRPTVMKLKAMISCRVDKRSASTFEFNYLVDALRLSTLRKWAKLS